MLTQEEASVPTQMNVNDLEVAVAGFDIGRNALPLR
jgi:hypothetical protein